MPFPDNASTLSSVATQSVGSLLTLLFSGVSLYFVVQNYLRLREPILSIEIMPYTEMPGGEMFGGFSWSVIDATIHYSNSTNNCFEDFHINCCIQIGDKRIDCSEKFPSIQYIGPKYDKTIAIPIMERIKELEGDHWEQSIREKDIWISLIYTYTFYKRKSKTRVFKWCTTEGTSCWNPIPPSSH